VSSMRCPLPQPLFGRVTAGCGIPASARPSESRRQDVAWAWGATGHEWATGIAIEKLPDDVPAFVHDPAMLPAPGFNRRAPRRVATP
jgi:hypothetical protein